MQDDMDISLKTFHFFNYNKTQICITENVKDKNTVNTVLCGHCLTRRKIVAVIILFTVKPTYTKKSENCDFEYMAIMYFKV